MIKLSHALSLALLLSLAASLHAADQPKDSDVATDGPLMAHLIVTNNGNELIEQWSRGASRISLRSIDQARRGEFVTIIVRFEGCAANQSGVCEAYVDYVASKPDGTLYGDLLNGVLWQYEPPGKGKSQLAEQYLGLVVEPSDPSGAYELKATVRDLVSGRTVVVSRSLEVPEQE